MVQKPGRNYAPLNKPVTIAELSTEGAVDYERERLNLRKRNDGAAAAARGANARYNQSRHVIHDKSSCTGLGSKV